MFAPKSDPICTYLDYLKKHDIPVISWFMSMDNWKKDIEKELNKEKKDLGIISSFNFEVPPHILE